MVHLHHYYFPSLNSNEPVVVFFHMRTHTLETVSTNSIVVLQWYGTVLALLIMCAVKSLGMRFFYRCRRKFDQIVWFTKRQKIHRTIKIRIKRRRIAFTMVIWYGMKDAWYFPCICCHILSFCIKWSFDDSKSINTNGLMKCVRWIMDSMWCEDACRRANRTSICYSSEIFNEAKLFIHASLHIQPHNTHMHILHSTIHTLTASQPY